VGGSEKRGCWWYSWIPCWLLTNAAVTSAVTEFQVPQIDCKSKKSKRTVTWKILFAMSIGKTRIVKSDNLQNNLVYTKTGKELQGGGGNSRASTGVAWPSCSVTARPPSSHTAQRCHGVENASSAVFSLSDKSATAIVRCLLTERRAVNITSFCLRITRTWRQRQNMNSE